ncbi:MAG: AAA family ATPase [Candidatus Obscuribacter sp.]|nr:AAA family ATPase [Candidatus Obscuribacter sp.]
MATGEQVKKLLAAHRDHDDATFFRVAQSIIADETAANHHILARELKKALGDQKKSGDLVVLPTGKDRVSLLNVRRSEISRDRLVLTSRTSKKIERVLLEHKSVLRLAKHGYQPKRKLLFWGPPGCGKTLTAHFLAHELGLEIGTVRLSSLISSYLGDTATHLESVFEIANKSPMVLLIDEVDAVGKTRDDPNDVGELKRVVNTLLQAMDNFVGNQSILIAATNHEYVLDAALWRRFDDAIEFPLPEEVEIYADLKRLLSGIEFEASLKSIVPMLISLSFAEIERITTEAVKTMILEHRDFLTYEDIAGQLEQLKRHSVIDTERKQDS